MHLDLHFQLKLGCFENVLNPIFFKSFVKIYLETRGKKLVHTFPWPFKNGLCLVFPCLESHIFNRTAV